MARGAADELPGDVGYAIRNGTEIANMETWDGQAFAPVPIPTDRAAGQYPASGLSDTTTAPEIKTTATIFSVGWQITDPASYQKPIIVRRDS